uniref:potassium channel family protein n=1 Tax=Parolsenella massiliensis TaxID=1871022 RepID=UPI000933AAE3|nr:NAD-binding protein [Parolsenella massiliensis]
MNIIIVGGGKVGSYLATLLGNRGYNVRIVESRKAVAQRLEEKLPEGSVVRGMGSSPDVLEEAGVLQADVIIAVAGDDEVNLVVAMLAKMEYGVNRVVARVNNPANAWMFDESMGVDIAVDQAEIITKSVEEGLDMEDVFTIMRLGKDGHEIVQGEVRPRSAMVGKSIAELQIPDGLVFVALEREGNTLIPNGDTAFSAGDRVVAFASEQGRDFLSHSLQ